jgi:hypothetical protein
VDSFIEKNKEKNKVGWYINKGYFYREGDKIISLNKENFNTLCGTCLIVRPKFFKGIFQHKPHLLYVHQTTEFDSGHKMEQLPFPGAIYSMANGENHYMSGGQIKNLNKGNPFKWSTIQSIFRKLRRYRFKTLNNTIKSEFGIYNLSNQ